MRTLQRQQIVAALEVSNLAADAMAPQVAAALIVAAVLPQTEHNPGAAFYRLKAEGWLSMLLASEPTMSLEQLAERVEALASVSKRVKDEIGAFVGRLHIIALDAS